MSRQRRGFVLVAAGLLAVCGVVGQATVAAAVPPFPIADSGSGTSNQVNPNWTIDSNFAGGGKYTADGWTRLTNAGANESTNLLNNTAFPSSTGIEVKFDYREARGPGGSGGAHGVSMYLIDGSEGISTGSSGSGTVYANNSAAWDSRKCGVKGGFVGVALSGLQGTFADSERDNTGGVSGGLPSSVGVRGSGEPCSGTTRYPWVGGNTVSGIETASTGDPVTSATSTYRRVRVLIQPQAGTLQLTVSMTAAVVKDRAPGAFTQVLTANLADVPGQRALPDTLKLGFGGTTSNDDTAYIDVRAIDVRANTDAQIGQDLSSITPGHDGFPAGTFLPGDAVSFVLRATNAGPSMIGDAPDGVAVVYDNLTALPLRDVSWTCAGSAGGTCVTGGGVGAVVSENWYGPPGAAVTVTVNATVATTVSSGTYTSKAVIPTDFTTMTLNPDQSTVQRDGGAADTNLSNNTAAVPFTVALVADPTTSTIAATPPETVANGVSTSLITVHLHDEHGNALTGGDDTVTINTSDGTLSDVTDAGNGTYTATLTAPDAVGRATIGFTVNGVAAPATTDVVFVPGPASSATSQIVADPTQIIADGTSVSTIAIALRDADGNAVRDGGNTVTMNTTAGTLSPANDNGNGTYTATLTSTRVVENATIGFTVNGVTADAQATVAFVADAPSPTMSTITANPTTITANGTDTSTITITLIDSQGHRLTTGGAVVAATSTAGRLSEVLDNGNGTYTATLTSSTLVDTATVEFSIDNTRASATATVSFTAGPIATGASTITATPETITPGGASTSTITATLRDDHGNQIPTGGATVTMSTTLGTLTDVLDNGDGTYTATLTAGTTTGQAIIGFTIDGTPATATTTVTIASPASTTQSTITATPASIPADGTSTSKITVTLRDNDGQPLTTGGDTVTIEQIPTTQSTPRVLDRKDLPALTVVSDLQVAATSPELTAVPALQVAAASPTLTTVTDNADGTYTATLTAPNQPNSTTIGFTINGTPATTTTTITFTPTPANPSTTSNTLADTGTTSTPLTLVALLAAGTILGALTLTLRKHPTPSPTRNTRTPH